MCLHIEKVNIFVYQTKIRCVSKCKIIIPWDYKHQPLTEDIHNDIK